MVENWRDYMNRKCEICPKKDDCTELCPAAKITALSGTIVPTGEELAERIKKEMSERDIE